MDDNKVFSDFEAFDSFVGGRKVTVVMTTNGSQLLKVGGKVSATIKNELKGNTIQETAEKLRSVNLVLGIPHAGSLDNQGNPSLPCLMEDKSPWEEIAL